VEHRDASAHVLKISEINTSIYVSTRLHCSKRCRRFEIRNAQSEYYLTDVIGILSAEGKRTGMEIPQADEILGINTRQEIAYSDRAMRRRNAMPSWLRA